MGKRAGMDILVNYQKYLKQFINNYEENDKLFELYRNSSTEDERIVNRNKIVEANLPLVTRFIVCKYNYNYDINPVYDMDDIIQEANLILLKAIDSYDQSKGKFSTFLYMKLSYTIYYRNSIPNTSVSFTKNAASTYRKIKKLIDLGFDDEFISEYYQLTLTEIKELRIILQDSLSYEELLENGKISDFINEQNYTYGNDLIEIIEEQPLIEKRNNLLDKSLNEIDEQIRDIIIDLYGLNGQKKIFNLSAYSKEIGENERNIYKSLYKALNKLRKDDKLLRAFLSVDSVIDLKSPTRTYYYKK